MGIALLKEYWNLGIGSAMFSELVAEAEKYDIEILELQFVEGNDRARHLYEKFGFSVVADAIVAMQAAIGTNSCRFIYDDAPMMVNAQARTEAISRNPKPQLVS